MIRLLIAAALLLATRAEAATITSLCSASSTSTGTSLGCTPVGASPAGSTVLVALMTTDGTGTVSVSDTAGNSYTKDIDRNYSGGNSRLVVWRVDNALALSTSDTVTVTHPSVASRTIRVLSVSGLATSSSFDVSATDTGTGTSFNTGATSTTAQAQSLVIGWFGIRDTNVGTCTAGSGYSGLLQAGTTGGATNRTLCIESKTVASTGTYNATATWTANRDWVAAVSVYKELLPTQTPTITRTPTITPTITRTPTITLTPTPGLVFATGFEHCSDPSTRWLVGTAAGSIVSGSGTGLVARRTPAPMAGETGNYCHLRVNAASGQSEYIELNQTATGTIGAHFDLYVATVPATARRVFSFYSNANTKRGCFASVEAAGSAVLLKTWYEDSANECSGSTNNYTECTLDAECEGINEGEGVCDSSIYAATTIGTSTWYHVAIGQTNSTGEVQCQLRVDGTDVGTQTRWQGKCAAGGDHPLYACRTDGDCGTSTPCTTTDVTTIDRVRVGIDDTVAAAADIYVDAVVIQTDGASGLDKVRIQALNPSAAGSSTQWTPLAGNNYAAVDDFTSGGAVDDATTYVESTASSRLDSYAMQDLTLAADESIQGVALTAIVSDTGNTGTDKVTQTCIGDGSSQICGTSADVAGYADANYSPALYSFFGTTAGGTAWTDASIDSLQGQINRVSATSSSSVRATALVAEAVVRQPVPESPNTLIDQNGDGVITVTVAGDSRVNDSVLSTLLAARLTQPNHILQCTRGGIATTELLAHINSILTGTSDSLITCRAAKGSTGKAADYLLLMIGINDFHQVPALPVAGSCYNSSGTVTGACRCLWTYNTESPDPTYCRQGAAWKTPCANAAACTGGPTSGLGCTQADTPTWCQYGCTDAVGCDGVCVQAQNTAAVLGRLARIVQAIRQYPSPPKVVFLKEPAVNPRTIGCWGNGFDGSQGLNNQVSTYASRYSWNVIETQAAFHAGCGSSCLRDGVHFATSASLGGNVTLADTIEDCLEHACLGGVNAGVACRDDSECPSSTCGTTNTYVSCSNL